MVSEFSISNKEKNPLPNPEKNKAREPRFGIVSFPEGHRDDVAEADLKVGLRREEERRVERRADVAEEGFRGEEDEGALAKLRA